MELLHRNHMVADAAEAEAEVEAVAVTMEAVAMEAEEMVDTTPPKERLNSLNKL